MSHGSSPTLTLAKRHLGEDLGDWAIRHRLDDRSWRWIADRLAEETGGEVRLSAQYLGRIYGRLAEEAADAQRKTA